MHWELGLECGCVGQKKILCKNVFSEPTKTFLQSAWYFFYLAPYSIEMNSGEISAQYCGFSVSESDQPLFVCGKEEEKGRRKKTQM
jgi:hypothetical protein